MMMLSKPHVHKFISIATHRSTLSINYANLCAYAQNANAALLAQRLANAHKLTYIMRPIMAIYGVLNETKSTEENYVPYKYI